jgi:phosphopantothenoylcysteine decarboxylase/phosphopantothenate--cysteine ligase
MSVINKNIILGVTGGIAAYKSADLCRQLKKAGANVRVVMTRGACEFVRPLTFQALSGEPVSTELLDETAEAGMGHIELAKWADLILIAPASANTIARLASGAADDLLSTLVLATTAQLALAPAMNQAMWANPITQRNVDSLREIYGARLSIIGPDAGEQACGDVGPGRMTEPLDIVEAISGSESAFPSIRVVVTAGPTREAIDPVRYISNHSSGKMGFALAEAFRSAGADVCVIAGPVSLSLPPDVERIDVESAQEMYDAAMEQKTKGFDIFIGAAAVADYAPVQAAPRKMKKNDQNLVIELHENPDIIASIAKGDNSSCLIVGFAAETNDVVSYAQGKLERKALDLVVANDVSDQSIGFNSDHNRVALVSRAGVEELPGDTKIALAKVLADRIYKQLKEKRKK